jgi:TolB-like protein/DNA-binding winged helix-turn-helix (wHTH) protein/Flp pilus assembly protein TadD
MQPHNPAESVARQPLAPVYQVDDLVVDTGRMTVARSGVNLALAKLSFDLLVALIEAAPRVVSPDELMDRVWPGLVVSPETVSQRIKLLRDSLGDDSKSPRYVAGVRGRGYRLLPDVLRPGGDGGSAEAIGAVPATGDKRRHFLLPLLTLVLIAATGAWLLLDRGREAVPGNEAASAAPLPARSVAVLAFEDRGGSAGTDILAQGIPETVLHQLARFPGLTVIARGSSFAFQDRDEDLRVIGRKLNVRYLLEGSVQTDGQSLRVTSSLVDAETGASVWSMQFDRAPQDVFAMQDEIAIEVARAMQITLDAGTDAVAGLQQGATEDYDAYFAFLRGRALLASLRIIDLPAAIESLKASIRHDPRFGAAHVLLARARVALAEQTPANDRERHFPAVVGEAMDLLDKAIALAPQNGEAYVERGYLKIYFDLAGADADLRRGLELAPNYSRGYEGLATVLFQSVARRREALEMIERARRLDPLEPRLDVIKATYLLFGPGDRPQAARLLESVLQRNPLYVPALLRLAEVYWMTPGKHAESAKLVEQAVALDPGNELAWQQLATCYMDIGDIAAAESALRNIADPPAYGWVSLHLLRKDWRRAGEAAYAMIAEWPPHPWLESRISRAIRMHARTTGEYERAIRTLESWAAVSWEGDEPQLLGQLDQGIGVAGLADLLMVNGHEVRARALAEALLEDTGTQIARYGRGEIWLNDGRAMALALLGRPEEAMATLQRQASSGVYLHKWQFLIEDEPAFEPLFERRDFRTLLADVRANAAQERERLERMRRDGLVPDRN